ncbi:MAG: 3-hydroxyacyl-ACP dehydratase FabZ family protein [bacterium]
MIDKITEWNVGASAQGIKNVTLSEDFFNDHFPRHPIMPGVLILESLAQLSGLLLETTAEQTYNLKIKALLTLLEKSKFRHVAKPGDVLNLTTTIVSVHEDSGRVKAQASINKKVAVESDMIFIFIKYDDPYLERKRKKLLDYWLRRDKMNNEI